MRVKHDHSNLRQEVHSSLFCLSGTLMTGEAGMFKLKCNPEDVFQENSEVGLGS